MKKKIAADFFLRAVSLHVDNCMWRAAQKMPETAMMGERRKIL